MSNDYKTGEWVRFNAALRQPKLRHQVAWKNPQVMGCAYSDFKGFGYQTWGTNHNEEIDWIYVYAPVDLPPLPEKAWSHNAGDELGVVTIVHGQLCATDVDGKPHVPIVSEDHHTAWDTYIKNALDVYEAHQDAKGRTGSRRSKFMALYNYETN